MAEAFPEDEIHLLSDQFEALGRASFDGLPNVVSERPSGPSFGGRWWSLGLPAEISRRRLDVFHGTDFSIPYLPAAPTVLTLHDLSPWKPPPLRPAGSHRVRLRTPRLVEMASLVTTPSEAIRREASAFFGLPPARCHAILHGCSREFRTATTSEIQKTLREVGVEQPYLLYLGRRDARKNVAGLQAAWRRLRTQNPGLGLVLAGSPDPEGEALAPECGVRVLEALDDGSVAALLSGASVFVYPSLYEGFGLPLLEAMSAGAPIVASLDPAVKETAGGAALHADARSAEALAGAIQSVIGNPQLASQLREKGYARAAALSWKKTAERTRAAYEQAIRRF